MGGVHSYHRLITFKKHIDIYESSEWFQFPWITRLQYIYIFFQPAVSSSVVPLVQDTKSREEVLEEQGKDKKGKARYVELISVSVFDFQSYVRQGLRIFVPDLLYGIISIKEH